MFKTPTLQSSLSDFSDVYILVKGDIAIVGDAGPPAGRSDAQLIRQRQKDERNNEIAFKNCAQSINCISEIKIDVVTPMYNSIECTDSYSKTSGSLWQCYKEKSGKGDDAAITGFESFKSKVKITGKTFAAGNRKNVEMAKILKSFLKNS